MKIDSRQAVIAAATVLALAVAPVAHAGSTKTIGSSTQVNLPVQPVVPIGVRIDPWNPLRPTEDSFKTYYDDPSIISRAITYAWERTRGDTAAALQAKLKEHDIGGGFRTYNAAVVLPPISTFSIEPARLGSRVIVKFTVPQISLTTSFRMPTPAPSGLDPRFEVNAPVEVSIALGFSGNVAALTSASVSTVIGKVDGPNGREPAGRGRPAAPAARDSG
jgi:hypothetical protein